MGEPSFYGSKEEEKAAKLYRMKMDREEFLTKVFAGFVSTPEEMIASMDLAIKLSS